MWPRVIQTWAKHSKHDEKRNFFDTFLQKLNPHLPDNLELVEKMLQKRGARRGVCDIVDDMSPQTEEDDWLLPRSGCG